MTGQATTRPAGRQFLWILTLWLLAIAFVTMLVAAAYLLGRTDRVAALAQAPVSGFLDSVSPPIWIILIVNLATLISSGVAAFAAFKVAPATALQVAQLQADVSRSAVDVAATSAEAASRSAEAAHTNATAAKRISENAGIHAVARLRQEWISELRGRVAQAYALLSNWRAPAPNARAVEKQEQLRRTIEANEVFARIELLLNPKEVPSQRLLAALRALQQSGGNTTQQSQLGQSVIAAAQDVLKEEWDRVRLELGGEGAG